MNGGPFYNQNPGRKVFLLCWIQHSGEWSGIQISEILCSVPIADLAVSLR